jgi:hypothetical protein
MFAKLRVSSGSGDFAVLDSTLRRISKRRLPSNLNTPAQDEQSVSPAQGLSSVQIGTNRAGAQPGLQEAEQRVMSGPYLTIAHESAERRGELTF